MVSGPLQPKNFDEHRGGGGGHPKGFTGREESSFLFPAERPARFESHVAQQMILSLQPKTLSQGSKDASRQLRKLSPAQKNAESFESQNPVPAVYLEIVQAIVIICKT